MKCSNCRTLDEENNPIVAKLDLFGCIEQHETTHKLTGLTVTVVLRKACDFLLPRLIKSAYKCNWIQADMNRYGDKSEELADYVKKFIPNGETIVLYIIIKIKIMNGFNDISADSFQCR